MINIGLIGTQSMHAWAFPQACNIPASEGKYIPLLMKWDKTA